MPPAPPAPTTLGALRASGFATRSVREELRENLLERMAAGKGIFDGVIGYDETVVPAVENALLCGHDLILLGERGQAKTRMIRGFIELLDEWLPIVAGSEINDDPFEPVSAYARELIAEQGDATEIHWLGREERYTEKLATPDVSIGDLIGDVDPIKVAEGRHLSDELTIHFGLLPRSLAVPLARLERYGMLIIIGVIFLLPLIGERFGMDLSVFHWLIGTPISWLLVFFDGLAGGAL